MLELDILGGIHYGIIISTRIRDAEEMGAVLGNKPPGWYLLRGLCYPLGRFAMQPLQAFG